MPMPPRNALIERIAPLLWFALLAGMVSQATNVAFLVVYPAMLLAVVALGFLALAWMVRWAKRRDSRPGQFGIAALLLLTFYIATLLSFVQWLLAKMEARYPASIGNQFSFFTVLLVCALFVFISLPAALWLVEGALWGGVRLTRLLIRRNISDSNDPTLPGV